MKIYSVNTIQPRNYSKPMLKKTNEVKSQFLEKNNNNQLVFKGDKGAVIGILSGAALGAGIAAATVLTGGLAGVVAAVGLTGTIGAGAAAGTHIGGIAGSIIEDKLNDKPPTP